MRVFRKKPSAVIPYILFILLLLFAGIYAITQETGEEYSDDIIVDDFDPDYIFPEGEEEAFVEEEEVPPQWMPPGPPRWFRSNAGGMTLEEIPSRLAAMRNPYTLVIDYLPPDEIDPRLQPFFNEAYTVEIRVLYEQGVEIRRQWLFSDAAGVTRLNAVFMEVETEPAENTEDGLDDGEAAIIIEGNNSQTDEAATGETETTAVTPNGDTSPQSSPDVIVNNNQSPPQLSSTIITDTNNQLSSQSSADVITTTNNQSSPPPPETAAVAAELSPLDEQAEQPEINAVNDESIFVSEIADSGQEITEETTTEAETPPVVLFTGFIEIFNENSQIIEDYLYAEDGSETLVSYSYNKNTLIQAETGKKIPGTEPAEYQKIHTDNYRYNRSFSLRNVERLFHEQTELEPVLLLFPGRVLDAVTEGFLITEKLPLESDFIGNFYAEAGFRMEYDTDSRGRILQQTMFDGEDETVWVITNTWSGDRIASTRKVEGEDDRLTEYEYDGDGNRIVQREIRNGVVERTVHTEGSRETEELYMNGVVVLRAYWENGRKISEERVRRQ